MIVLLVVDGAILASFLFGWYYLAAGSAEWSPAAAAAPAIGTSALAALGWAAGSVAIEHASRLLRAGTRRAFAGMTALGTGLLAGACVSTACALADSGAEPAEHAYGAMAHTLFYWQALHSAVAALMGIYVLIRLRQGLIDARRRATFDHARLFAHYTAAQGLLILLVWRT